MPVVCQYIRKYGFLFTCNSNGSHTFCILDSFTCNLECGLGGRSKGPPPPSILPMLQEHRLLPPHSVLPILSAKPLFKPCHALALCLAFLVFHHLPLLLHYTFLLFMILHLCNGLHLGEVKLTSQH